jgi:hypothetical protein
MNDKKTVSKICLKKVNALLDLKAICPKLERRIVAPENDRYPEPP